MSQTFTLKGRSSCLSIDISPPIVLDSRYNYSLALISLSTWNSIPNIEPGCNKFYYFNKNYHKKKFLVIPTGSYEILDVESLLNKLLDTAEGGGSTVKLILKPNNNTLKAELKCVYDIDFQPADSIGSILGFSRKLLPANKVHESDLPVNIIKVSSIRIECNIVSGSYYTNNPSHTVYEFTPSVDPGYSIIVEPRNLIYLPVNKSSIDNITVDLLDQDSNPINFRGEEIIIRLELKKHGISD